MQIGRPPYIHMPYFNITMCYSIVLSDVIKPHKEVITSEFIVIVNVSHKKAINVN